MAAESSNSCAERRRSTTRGGRTGPSQVSVEKRSTCAVAGICNTDCNKRRPGADTFNLGLLRSRRDAVVTGSSPSAGSDVCRKLLREAFLDLFLFRFFTSRTILMERPPCFDVTTVVVVVWPATLVVTVRCASTRALLALDADECSGDVSSTVESDVFTRDLRLGDARSRAPDDDDDDDF